MSFIVRRSDHEAIGLIEQRPYLGTHYAAQFRSPLDGANGALWNLITTVVDIRKMCISRTVNPDRYHIAVRTRGAGPSEWDMFFGVFSLSQTELETIQAFSLFEVK